MAIRPSWWKSSQIWSDTTIPGCHSSCMQLGVQHLAIHDPSNIFRTGNWRHCCSNQDRLTLFSMSSDRRLALGAVNSSSSSTRGRTTFAIGVVEGVMGELGTGDPAADRLTSSSLAFGGQWQRIPRSRIKPLCPADVDVLSTSATVHL